MLTFGVVQVCLFSVQGQQLVQAHQQHLGSIVAKVQAKPLHDNERWRRGGSSDVVVYRVDRYLGHRQMHC